MDRLRVLTLNIWHRQGPWPERLAIIRRGLETLGPDVVGLQEVLAMGDANQAKDIAEGSDWHVHYASTWEIGGGLRFGNAIVSRHPFLDTGYLELPTDDDDEPRCVAYALLDTQHGAVPVFNTHLAWRLHQGALRLRQVKAITDYIDALRADTLPALLLGDFNAEPDADEMRFLRGLTAIDGQTVYFNDCWDTCRREDDRLGRGATFDRTNPYALTLREPSRRIDYIYVRGPDKRLRGEPLSARVVLDQPENGVWASDHYGVYAEISIQR